MSGVPKKMHDGRFCPPHFKNISTHSSKSSFKSDPIPKNNKHNLSEKFSSPPISQPHIKHSPPGLPGPLPSIFHPYPQVKAYKPNNILGNFKLDIQKNHCQLQVSLADTLHSGRTFDLSFHGNDVHTTISEFGQCVERLHKL